MFLKVALTILISTPIVYTVVKLGSDFIPYLKAKFHLFLLDMALYSVFFYLIWR